MIKKCGLQKRAHKKVGIFLAARKKLVKKVTGRGR